MRMLTTVAICACFALMGGHAFGQPQPQVVTTVTAKQVATVLQSAGYRASVITDADGSKSVKSTMNNTTIWVTFAACNNDNCSVIRFYTGWQRDPNGPLTINFANTWNANWRYAKAYIADNGNFYFVLNVDLEAGVTLDTIKSEAGLFDYLLGEFLKQVRSGQK
jgi:Putative bacterial sensory transduction regulator